MPITKLDENDNKNIDEMLNEYIAINETCSPKALSETFEVSQSLIYQRLTFLRKEREIERARKTN